MVEGSSRGGRGPSLLSLSPVVKTEARFCVETAIIVDAHLDIAMRSREALARRRSWRWGDDGLLGHRAAGQQRIQTLARGQLVHKADRPGR